MSEARDRTVRHMRQMLTATAITGVAIGASADDGSAPKPSPSPSSSEPYGEGEWHMQHANPDAAPPNRPPGGYAVVDPMPEPARNRGCGCHKNDPYE